MVPASSRPSTPWGDVFPEGALALTREADARRELWAAFGLTTSDQPSCATRARAIGQAPSDVFEITVHVCSRSGSWVLRKDTPAS